MEITND